MPKAQPDRTVSLDQVAIKDFNKIREQSAKNKIKVKNSELCLRCRGAKKLCGKKRCPILVKYYNQNDNKSLDTLNLEGSSPPSVFIGRYNYPKVNVGPLVPPEKGDTSLLGTPEKWYGKDIDSIISFRSKLVRGKKKANVKQPDAGGRDIHRTRTLALAKKPAETEVNFKKKPLESVYLDGESQPYGPSASMTNLDVGTFKAHQKLEKAFYDWDLKAVTGVQELYEKNIPVSKIQSVFMVGGLGQKKQRKMVPTRWSITAVDDTIGKNLRHEIKLNPKINSYRVYETNYLDNRWIVIMMPTNWRYELIEAWFPETTWNPSGNDIVIFGDHEEFNGRKEYAQIGGCYYAARLAVAEKLREEHRQAGAVILRESHPGYILPVGVWNVRETVRNMLQQDHREFDTLRKAVKYSSQKLDIPINDWIQTSHLLREKKYQSTVKQFMGNR